MAAWKRTEPPAGYDLIERVVSAMDRAMREAVAESHEGKRKVESQWPVHQINNQRTRYIYDMFSRYKRISKELYDWCIEEKLADAALIAKWKKPGYDRLCSTFAVNPKNFNFGTVSKCRVPHFDLPPGTIVIDQHSGCMGCASGPGGFSNIFGNRFGQNLADIQHARERGAELEKEGASVAEAIAALRAALAREQESFRRGGPRPPRNVRRAILTPNGEVWATDDEELLLMACKGEVDADHRDSADVKPAASATSSTYKYGASALPPAAGAPGAAAGGGAAPLAGSKRAREDDEPDRAVAARKES